MILKKIFSKLNVIRKRLIVLFYHRLFFKKIGAHTYFGKGLILVNPGKISIGRNCSIGNCSRLEVIDAVNPDAILEIGDNVNIEQNVHIVCGNKIRIEDNVSITANCAIVDIAHPFLDITHPLKIGQQLDCTQQTTIGKGSFLGIGAVILPGVVIGKNCVIGANSVITKSVPDYCVVAGNPAKIIKRYNFEKNEWEKI